MITLVAPIVIACIRSGVLSGARAGRMAAGLIDPANT